MVWNSLPDPLFGLVDDFCVRVLIIFWGGKPHDMYLMENDSGDPT